MTCSIHTGKEHKETRKNVTSPNWQPRWWGVPRSEDQGHRTTEENPVVSAVDENIPDWHSVFAETVHK